MKIVKKLFDFNLMDMDLSDSKQNGTVIYLYTLFWSLAFLLCVPIACICSGEGWEIFYNFYLILITPCSLITDYFNIGSMASTFLNAALCGIACNLMILYSRARAQARILAGYFLVIAHCFYGLNFLNMWPTVLGVYVYCKITHKRFAENVHTAMFSTALAPFISDFLFRYTTNENFVFGEPRITAAGVVFALLFGLAAGFAVPALLPATTNMTRGFSLYKAGLAIGILGMFVYSFMYKTLGLSSPGPTVRNNPVYEQNSAVYTVFMNCFFITMFALSVLFGFLLNKKSFQGYVKLLGSTGHGVDFIEDYGAPDSIINMGILGLCIVLFFNIIFITPLGMTYTGATAGVTIAAITFSASGKTPKNVWPIGVGYVLLNIVSYIIAGFAGVDLQLASTTQAYINSFAFATGLCPFTGKYGWKIGIVAGMLNGIICTSTSVLHGGFVLYNGGFTAGLTAMVLLPILDFYNVKQLDAPAKDGGQVSEK
ncbi:MAG: DUF1576 domain-containing protein [Clostridia bacterium]|nr:DUF1576 domain-containing protein [Clostridia bacterium]